MVLFLRKPYFSKDPEYRGGPPSSRWSNSFQGGGGSGLNVNFYRNPYNF